VIANNTTEGFLLNIELFIALLFWMVDEKQAIYSDRVPFLDPLEVEIVGF